MDALSSPAQRLPLAQTLVLCLAAALAGCAATVPATPPPALDVPAQFHHEPGWLATAALPDQPASDAEGAAWWQPFDDAELAALMAAIEADNPTLAEAAARWRAAEAGVAATRAATAPQLGAQAGALRSGRSGEGPQNQFQLGLDASWTLDLWGRQALQTSAAQAQADAQQQDLQAARLALQFAAAQSLVQARHLALQHALLAQTQQAYERSLALTQNQYEAGFVARSDVIQAQTQLQSVRTQITVNERAQALAHNTLALLAGRSPAQWPAPASLGRPLAAPPPVAAQLPAQVLLARPDLQAAQLRLRAAQAQLGIAQTAWLPDVTLSASGSLQAGSWSRLLDAPVRVWSLGPSLAAALLDGGARTARTAQAQAEYEASSAAWRAAALQALREAEDALASIRWLEQLHTQQQELARLAGDNLRVMHNQYEAGMVSFLEVATAQNTALAAQRNLLNVQSERLLARLQLLAALGAR